MARDAAAGASAGATAATTSGFLQETLLELPGAMQPGHRQASLPGPLQPEPRGPLEETLLELPWPLRPETRMPLQEPLHVLLGRWHGPMLLLGLRLPWLLQPWLLQPWLPDAAGGR